MNAIGVHMGRMGAGCGRLLLRIMVLMGGGVLISPAGCASLASTTGPAPDGYTWSSQSRQEVHIGEQVEFDFILLDFLGRRVNPAGKADYAVVTIGSTHLTTEPDLNGRFRFSYLFDEVEPGDPIAVNATAYIQNGVRDFIVIRGKSVATDSPYDDLDKRVASDSLTLVPYQRDLLMRIPRPQHDLDLSTGVLKLTRRDGTSTSIFTATPTRSGFVLDGPDHEGYYEISYSPRGGELSSCGTTQGSFKIYDITGQPYEEFTVIDSP